MIRPSDSLKQACQRAAEALVTKSNRDEVLRTLSDHGVAVAPESRAGESQLSAEQGASVGIWREGIERGEKWFVREPNPSARLWADIERIPPKGNRRRVVLLGESAARGYFYDPHYTFARAVADVLTFGGANDVEVIDLARTDAILQDLVELMQQAISLEPDVLLVFAGNNWVLTHQPPNFSMETVSGILREGGGPGEIREYCEDVLRGLARTFLETASTIAARHGIPTVYVLPEFNLIDWKNEKVDQTPFLSSDEAALWESARVGAIVALGIGCLDEAESMAHRVTALDKGTTPTGYMILAECARARSRRADMRFWLERARDAGHFLPVGRSPRCHTVVQETMRRECGPNGVYLVDLPETFADYLAGELPDRRMFLDYCHLTIEGLRIAAAAAVERVLDVLGRPAHTWRELADARMDVPSNVLSEGLFQAAIHNAHWGQGPDLVTYQCGEAVRIDPLMLETMLRFVDSALRCAPALVCESMNPIARDATAKSASALQLFNSLPPLRKNLNLTLTEAMLSAMTPLMPALRETTDRLLISEYCAGNGPCDFLLRAFSSASLEDWDWLNGTIHYRARRRLTPFRFVCCRPFPLVLDLTLRTCKISPPADAVMTVNGVRVASIRVSPEWRTHRIEIHESFLNEGLNSLSIAWPEPSFTVQDRMAAIQNELEDGRIPTVAFVYGEVARLRATAAFDGRVKGCNHDPIYWKDLESHLPPVRSALAAVVADSAADRMTEQTAPTTR